MLSIRYHARTTIIPFLFLALLLLSPLMSRSQSVGVNTTGAAPDPSAMLDVAASDKGVLIPRVELNDVSTQAPVSAAPVEGLLIYNSTGSEPNGYYYWDGTQWTDILNGSAGINTSLVLNGTTLELTDPGGTLTEDLSSLVDDADADPTNEYNTSLSLSGTTLELTDPGATLTQDLSNLGSYWQIDGNSNIGAGNFLGTTNSNPLRVRTNNTERMRVASSGEIGFFETAPSPHFIRYTNPGTTSDWQVDFTNDASGIHGLMRVRNTQSDNGARNFLGITNYNSNTYESPGVMGLGLNSSLSASGSYGVIGHNNSDEGYGTLGRFVGGTDLSVGGWALFGSGWSGGTSAWQNVSDRRLKKDIQELEDPLAKIQKIRGVNYRYDTEKYGHLGLDEGKRIGVIAQEVEEVLPYAVREANVPGNPGKVEEGLKSEHQEEEVKTLGYSSLIPLLLEGVKAQQERIDELEGRLEEMEARLQKLESEE